MLSQHSKNVSQHSTLSFKHPDLPLHIPDNLEAIIEDPHAEESLEKERVQEERKLQEEKIKQAEQARLANEKAKAEENAKIEMVVRAAVRRALQEDINSKSTLRVARQFKVSRVESHNEYKDQAPDVIWFHNSTPAGVQRPLPQGGQTASISLLNTPVGYTRSIAQRSQTSSPLLGNYDVPPETTPVEDEDTVKSSACGCFGFFFAEKRNSISPVNIAPSTEKRVSRNQSP